MSYIILIGGCVIAAFFLARFLKKPSVEEKNAEAMQTIDSYLSVSDSEFAEEESRVLVHSYLHSLQSLLRKLVVTNPDHNLTGRVRFIVDQNMYVLFPEFQNMTADQTKEALKPFNEQLKEVQDLFDTNQLDAAAKAAHKPFNWELRDYFTL